jgi:hypothetical protein
MKGSKRKRKGHKKQRNMINLKTVRRVEKGLEDGQRKYY